MMERPESPRVGNSDPGYPGTSSVRHASATAWRTDEGHQETEQ